MSNHLVHCLVVLSLALFAQGHMSIYVPSMWGSQPDNINSDWAVQPLENLDFTGWWMHGPQSLNDAPPANVVTSLPAGGTIDFEITGNKAFTSMGRGLWCKPGATPRMIPDPWSNNMGGGSSNIHAPTYADVAGCALGIAYKSNVNDVLPTDFVIVSVVHDCIARQLQTFDIPALPPCANNMCICSWFWIHNSTGGSDQMYMTAFQCNVTNASKRVIGKPVAPVRCDGKPPCYLYPKWGNSTDVCPKTLNPLYWGNNEGNNIDNPTNIQCAPTYNTYYGFPDGAQNQIFIDDPPAPAGSVGDTLYSNGLAVLSSAPSSVLVSPSYYTQLAVQANGNVVMSDVNSGKVYWSTNTGGQGAAPYSLTLGWDGNLELTDSHSTVLWSTDTSNKGFAPYRLKMRDMVNLTVVDRDSSLIWTATTSL